MRERSFGIQDGTSAIPQTVRLVDLQEFTALLLVVMALAIVMIGPQGIRRRPGRVG